MGFYFSYSPLLGRYVLRWEMWALGGLDETHKPRTVAGVSYLLVKLEGLIWLTPAEPNTC